MEDDIVDRVIYPWQSRGSQLNPSKMGANFSMSLPAFTVRTVFETVSSLRPLSARISEFSSLWPTPFPPEFEPHAE